MNPDTTTSNPPPPPIAPDDNPESTSPFDSILSQLDGFIANPSRINKDMLVQLKSEVEDLKSGFDSNEPDESMSAPTEPGTMSHDLMQMHMNKQGGGY